MLITDTLNLPDIINTVTTWESAILNLAKYCLDLQTAFNNSAPADDQVSFITIEADFTGANPDCTITLTGVQLYLNPIGRYTVGRSVEEPFDDAVYSAGSSFPWNGQNALDTLVGTLQNVFIYEKNPVNNPNDLDKMTITKSQNTNQNEAEFTLDVTVVLPIIVSQSGEGILYIADEYLEGSV